MQKRKQTRIRYLLSGILCVLCLCGCALDVEPEETFIQESLQSGYETEKENREGFVGEEEYEQNFTRPQVNSNIYIDLMGYAPDDQKYAYFVGNDLSETFYVVESSTGECVFTGILKKLENQKSDGKSVYKGDFSSLTEPGVYYIQTPIIGQSFAFCVNEDRYQSQYSDLKKEFIEQTPEKYYGNAESAEERMAVFYSFQKLAAAYQFFPDACGESYEKKLEEHAEWILELQKEVLAERDTRKREGSLKTNYAQPDEEEMQIVNEDYMFASAMAAGYYVLEPLNASLAARSLSEAQKAYQNASRYKLTGDIRYMAAASLFRAVGSYSYHAVIREAYAQQEENSLKNGYQKLPETEGLLCDIRLWGNLFYMTSLKGADMTICDGQMAEMMTLCGKYLDGVPKSAFGLIAEKEDSLEGAVWLTIADYIIVSREYRNVCRQQIHSFMYNMEEADLLHQQKTTLLLILANLEESGDTE